jgi:tripartite-type tricarboxylate transporter receptor subunit TctC
MISNVAHTAAKVIYPDVPYDFVSDMTHVARFAEIPNIVIVGKDSPIKSFKGLIDYLRKNPNPSDFGASGPVHQLNAELLAKQAGVRISTISYKGTPPLLSDLIGGRLTFALDTGAGIAQVKSGNVVALAVTTRERLAALPNVPTVAESGFPKYITSSWYGIEGPKGLPDKITAKIYRAINDISKSQAVMDTLESMAGRPSLMGPPNYAEFVKSESETWASLK